MIKEIECSIYILSRQPEGVVCYGRIHRQDLLDLEDKENYVKENYVSVNYHGQVLDFSKDTVFRDEVIPEIEPDSYLEVLSNNIGNYAGRYIIRVMEIARGN